MDPFDKAVERARIEGQGESIRSWISASSTDTTVEASLPQGRAVDLDPATLRDNLVLIDVSTPQQRLVADQYRLLRTRVLQLMKEKSQNLLGVTSPAPRAGKSLTAINMSISISRTKGQSVVLVDADLRNPSVAEVLGIETQYGLIDFLAGTVGLEDVLVQTDISGLSVIPGRRAGDIGDLPELLTSDRLRALLGKMSQETGTFIVLDLPPVLVGADVISISPLLHALLMVVHDGATQLDDLTKALQLLDGCNLLGTVLNQSSEGQDKGGYGYGY
ncbi:MAG: CpsD/CapB family tyrosine-protein kinase [Pseudomonadota bacterium]